MLCTFGAAPAPFNATPRPVLTSSRVAGTILDSQPMLNVMPFAMCLSPANPAVIAATSAALGVFTPMPCVPATPGPWAPGAPTVTIGGVPALDNGATLSCLWGGVVSFTFPGQLTESIP